jgi:hypothetical protein
MPSSPDSPTGPPTPWSPPSQPRDPQATRSEDWFGGQQAGPGPGRPPADYPQTGAWAYPQPPVPPGPGGYPPHPPGPSVPTPPPSAGEWAGVAGGGPNDPRYGGGGGYGAPPPPGAPPPNGYYGQPQQPGYPPPAYPPPAYPGQATQPQPGYPPNPGFPGGYQGQGGPPAPGYPPAAYAAQVTAPMAPTTPSSGADGANDPRGWPRPGPGGPGGPAGPAGPGGPDDPRNWGEATRQYAAFQQGRDAGPAAETKRNMPATVSLFTWVIPLIGLVVGIAGLVTARRSGVGLKRAVAGTLLSLLVLGGIGVFVPKVLKASDPGCTYFKGTALPAYNQMIGNLDHQKLTPASGTQVRAVAAELAVAQGKSKSASVQSALHSLITQLGTIQNDASKGSLPPSATTALNSAASSLDSACGSGY